jgi:hypothetical protein
MYDDMLARAIMQDRLNEIRRLERIREAERARAPVRAVRPLRVLPGRRMDARGALRQRGGRRAA